MMEKISEVIVFTGLLLPATARRLDFSERGD